MASIVPREECSARKNCNDGLETSPKKGSQLTLVTISSPSLHDSSILDSPFIGNPVVKRLSHLERCQENRNKVRERFNSIRAELVNGTYKSMDLTGIDTTSLHKETAEGEAVLREYEVSLYADSEISVSTIQIQNMIILL